MKTFGNIFWAAIGCVVRVVLSFDRKVIKRYTGMETPIYKLWWKGHSECIQRQLNAERDTRESLAFFEF